MFLLNWHQNSKIFWGVVLSNRSSCHKESGREEQQAGNSPRWLLRYFLRICGAGGVRQNAGPNSHTQLTVISCTQSAVCLLVICVTTMAGVNRFWRSWAISLIPSCLRVNISRINIAQAEIQHRSYRIDGRGSVPFVWSRDSCYFCNSDYRDGQFKTNGYMWVTKKQQKRV